MNVPNRLSTGALSLWFVAAVAFACSDSRLTDNLDGQVVHEGRPPTHRKEGASEGAVTWDSSNQLSGSPPIVEDSTLGGGPADASKRRVWTVRASGCIVLTYAPERGSAFRVLLTDAPGSEVDLYGQRHVLGDVALSLWLTPHPGYPGLCSLDITRACQGIGSSADDCVKGWEHVILLTDVVVVDGLHVSVQDGQPWTVDNLQILPSTCNTPRWITFESDSFSGEAGGGSKSAERQSGARKPRRSTACEVVVFPVDMGGISTMLGSFGVRENTRIGVRDGRPFIRVDHRAPRGLPIQDLYTLPPLDSP